MVNQDTFATECLAAHNELRARHGSPPLQLNPQLVKLAIEWAQTLAKTKAMKHRPNNIYGENVYMAAGKEPDGGAAVNMWYSEISKYNFNDPKFSPNTGHFTQVIWKDTKELGCGIANNGNAFFVVCNYNPPGNVKGGFKENVQPKK